MIDRRILGFPSPLEGKIGRGVCRVSFDRGERRSGVAPLPSLPLKGRLSHMGSPRRPGGHGEQLLGARSARHSSLLRALRVSVVNLPAGVSAAHAIALPSRGEGDSSLFVIELALMAAAHAILIGALLALKDARP